MTTQKAIQEALYARLRNNISIPTVGIVSVWDEAPQGTPFPYVTIGGLSTTPMNTLTSVGRNTIATVTVWSRHNGNEESNAIADAIDDLLDHQRGSLTVAGATVVSVQLLDARQIGSPDGITRHLILRYRIRTE